MLSLELSINGRYTRRISGPAIALGREHVGQHVRPFVPATVCRITEAPDGLPMLTRERADIDVGLNGGDLELGQPAPMPRQGTIEIAQVSFDFRIESR